MRSTIWRENDKGSKHNLPKIAYDAGPQAYVGLADSVVDASLDVNTFTFS